MVQISLCVTPNILLFCSNLNPSVCDNFETAFTALGFSFTTIENTQLTTSDFDGINVFFDATFSSDSDCGTTWDGTTQGAINTYMSSGGATYFVYEGSSYNGCNQEKLDLMNPYITDPTIQVGNDIIGGETLMATSLKDTSNCVLSVPNDVSGKEVVLSYANDFSDSIDADSSLVIDDGSTVAGIWSGSDTNVANLRIIGWSDINHSFHIVDTDVLENMVTFLANGCCEYECDGLECGTGFCEGDCGKKM